jgi:hypothetical protein
LLELSAEIPEKFRCQVGKDKQIVYKLRFDACSFGKIVLYNFFKLLQETIGAFL